MRCAKCGVLNPATGASYARRRYEVTTSGYDPYLQGIGGDPYGGSYSMGIQIPAIAPPTNDFKHRFLFNLAMASFGAHQKGRLVGVRQYLEIGQLTPGLLSGAPANYPVTLPVTSPRWHFTDANVSWHLLRVSPVQMNTANLSNADGLQYLYGNAPSLLYVKTPADIGGYVPPGSGQPIGQPWLVDLANFNDMRFPWLNSSNSYLNEEFEGPCDIVLFASVQQTTPSSRVTLVAPTDLGVLLPEDRFILTYTSAVYTRIAGSLVFEEENMLGDPYPMIEKPQPGGIVP